LRALLIATLLFGCATVPKAPPFVPPSVSFQELRVDKLDFDGAEAVLLYAVKNPNAQPLTLSRVFFLFQANGRAVETGQPADGFEIAPGDSQLAFPVKLVWQQLVPVWPALAPEERMHYLATGSAAVETPLGPQRFDLSHEDALPMPGLPSVNIEPPKLTSLTPLGARMAIPLRLVNRNDYPVTVTAIEANAAFAAGCAGTLVLPSQGTLQPHEEKVVEATVDFAFFSRAIEASRVLRDGGSAVLVIDGSMAVGEWGMPFHTEQPVTVQRSEAKP
jgi:LEA14-like dessication related protein